MKTDHVVNFSGGVCSFWAAARVVAKYGPENVTLLFADVLMEDEDLYRFNAEASAHLGVPITRVSIERSPWDLFLERGMIGNSRFPVCSVVLKREPLDGWIKANCRPDSTTRYLGLDWTEEHRLIAARKILPDWRVEAPMCEAPLWDKCQMIEELNGIGIAAPKLYGLGMAHNNCGGFCVKAGHAQFARLLATMPDRYAMHEAKEDEWRAKVGKDFSVLTDRRGDGKKKPLTLRAFRERIEAGESFDRNDWGGCGCAVDSQPLLLNV